MLETLVESIDVSQATDKYLLLESDGTLPLDSTVVPAGVAGEDGDSGDHIDLVLRGETKCVASGAISKFDLLMPAGDGSGKVATYDSGVTGAVVIGMALRDASADGAYVDCDLFDRKSA